MKPWSAELSDLADHHRTDLATGLTSHEATDRLNRYGPNRIEPAPPVPKWRRFLAQFADPLVYLLLAAVVISLVVWVIDGAEGTPFEAIVIAAILVANAVFGYGQEARAEQAVAALQKMAATTSSVLRDGIELRIPSEELVPGDILVLGEGDAVSADGRLIAATSLTVAEAALTGESEPVWKDATNLTGDPALGDRVNMVFSGTAVTRGSGWAIITSTGMDTEIGRIAELLETTQEDPTPLQQKINHVGRLLGRGVLVITTVIVATILATSEISEAADLVEVLLVGVSLAVAAVPEGLPALLSIVLAVGVQRMARQQAIVKQLASVETLGSASVICSDKTGTLTRNEMTIQRIVTHSGTIEVTGTGYRPEGRLLVDGRDLQAGPLKYEAEIVLSAGSLASDATLREEDGEWLVHGDPTEAAFLVAELKAGFTQSREERFERVGEVPFTSERMLMSTLQSDAIEDHVDVMTKGAPDVLLTRCTHEQVGTSVRELDDERREEILADVDALADKAFRTLAVAFRPLSGAHPWEAGEHLEQNLILAGVVGIIDPPRDEARRSIAEAHQAGIRVVMITGDHPRTAQRIAADLGIAQAGDLVLTGTEMDQLDDGGLRELVDEISVYARVEPAHKLRIVDALQAEGNIVAMTGDGVNDAPALKSADIGVAMGTGTEVTKEAANMILADDNFATIVTAVREGRAIFANIRKFLRYLLSSNVGELFTMFLGVMFAGVIGLSEASGTVAVPLLATQILWINLLTDSAPALALGFDPPPDDVMARPPRRLSERIIDREMITGIGLVGFVMAIATLLTMDIALPGGLIEGSGTLDQARTMAFTTLVLAQLFNCFNARSDRTSVFHHLFSNPWLWAAVALSLSLQVAVVHIPVLNSAFGTTPIDGGAWVLCAVMASSVLWVGELRKLVANQRRSQQLPVRAV